LRHRDTGEAVTVGVGLHAARHRDTPVRWHFVAGGRVGADFSLITGDDRPMTRKQLTAEIGEASLYASPRSTGPPSTSACSASAGSVTNSCSP